MSVVLSTVLGGGRGAVGTAVHPVHPAKWMFIILHNTVTQMAKITPLISELPTLQGQKKNSPNQTKNDRHTQNPEPAPPANQDTFRKHLCYQC